MADRRQTQVVLVPGAVERRRGYPGAVPQRFFWHACATGIGMFTNFDLPCVCPECGHICEVEEFEV